MLENAMIKAVVQSYIETHRIAGATMIVRKGRRIVCDAHYGFADIERKIPIDNRTILRLASMTKPIVAIAVMQLEERGLLSINDPIGKYLPQFKRMKVAEKLVGFMDFYEADPDNPAMPRAKPELLEGVGVVDANREVTIRDMLTHSSGMGQGPFSMTRYDKRIVPGQSLEERVDLIAQLPLDFQPGSCTGYSASVAFDVLGRLVESVSGVNLNDYIRDNICKPLGCADLSFELTDEQRSRIARLYEGNPDGLRDVSDTEAFWPQVSPLEYGYYSGSAGMLGSVEAYDQVVQMLANNGTLDGMQILKPETVGIMSVEASVKHLEMCPGMTWGLGMAVSEAPEKIGRCVGKGAFGWSGAYGTHFYIDPENDVTVTLGVNCSNIGGADSQFSKDIEKAVMQEFNQEGYR